MKNLMHEADKKKLPEGFDFKYLVKQFDKQQKAYGNQTHGGKESGVNVNAPKLIPSYDYKPIAYSHTGSGVFFINFGTIIDGNENVHGAGNELGNGNGNGNDNGNGNGAGHAQGGGSSGIPTHSPTSDQARGGNTGNHSNASSTANK